MSTSKSNQRTAVLGIILIGLLIVAYKVMFTAPTEEIAVEGNIEASARVETILNKVNSIRFDTSVMEDEKFMSLESIETPIMPMPVGRKNPFSPLYSSR